VGSVTRPDGVRHLGPSLGGLRVSSGS
jgi:hypothetical protein